MAEAFVFGFAQALRGGLRSLKLVLGQVLRCSVTTLFCAESCFAQAKAWFAQARFAQAIKNVLLKLKLVFLP